MRMTKVLACVVLLTALSVYAAELGCVGDCANGTGTFYYDEVERYEGEWKDNTQHGQGTYYLANGDRYEGEWKYDIQHGQGTYYFANGNRYEGEWKNHRQHGQGTYYVCVLSVCFAVVSWIYDLYVYAFVAVGVVALFLIYYGVQRQYESKRSEALQSTAFSLGMSFEDGHNINATRRFGPFHLFSKGSLREVRNCLSGTIDGVDVTTFGYEYTVNIGEISTNRRQTAVLFHSNELSLPDFELRPRRFFGVSTGFDIDFDSCPDFSKSYFLRGNDESAIRHVFSTRVLDYFERHKGLFVEGRSERLLCYISGALVEPDEIKRFIDEGRALFGLFRVEP